MVKLKHQKDDVFVRVDKNGGEREPWDFLRDDNGAVNAVKRHSQINYKIK